MFQGIVIGAVGGLVLGTIYGKYVLADVVSLKAHVTKEVGSIKTAIATELAKIRIV
jgi:hypothetical protein